MATQLALLKGSRRISLISVYEEDTSVNAMSRRWMAEFSGTYPTPKTNVYLSVQGFYSFFLLLHTQDPFRQAWVTFIEFLTIFTKRLLINAKAMQGCREFPLSSVFEVFEVIQRRQSLREVDKA